MPSIRQYQEEHKVWVEHNFPSQPLHNPLLGIVEEVGELAHAHLKTDQGIREGASGVETVLQKADALGDIFIYMLSYCNSNHLDLSVCIEDAWREVKKRDWRRYPTDGVSC
jgi:NTP pyrophosphatase (non-canonical NTP hydrolase)